MSLPIVITHPSTLLHDGLRQLFAKSRFRPLRIAQALTEDLEDYLKSLKGCVWLTGVDKGLSETNALVRRVVRANSGVKAVILAPTQSPEDIIAALHAGACGFLGQDVAGDTLLRSLELISYGEMIVHPQLVLNQTPAEERSGHTASNGANAYPTRTAFAHVGHVELGAANENQAGDVPSLSRREMLILRMLMQGASNKIIARNLVITESTVKVHMKAILRKLRLQNRTQAAIWARNNVKENDFEQRTVGMGSAH